ncbi:MAG: exodeoxyribonuclease V subunit gamma [Prevotella sp.]|nr:exodeoxyribonuclease V subunit gamma [Prevotella sp.]
MWQVLTNPVHYPVDVNKGTRTKLDNFVALIQSFRAKLTEMDAATLGRHIIQQAGIGEDLYNDKTPEGEARQENLQEFYSSLQEFVDMQTEEGNQDQITITDFLQQAALQTDQESVDAKDDNTPKVTLMTMHAAKGLEFDCVFIVGLEEELFPSPRSVESQRALEEERRLLYVAITRAKKFCFLLHAQSRYLYGQWQSNPVSRFVKEINPSLLKGKTSETLNTTILNTKPNYSHQPKFNSQQSTVNSQLPTGNFRRVQVSPSKAADSTPKKQSDRGNLTIGATVSHTRFGRGKVLNIEGTGDNEKATVDFEQVGRKQLLLKFALPNMTIL